MKKIYDIFIIGGGINGAGIARDASGRGLKVALADKGKVGHATSSWSTKLIHGGLRYLENYEFKLVRESLKERTILNNIASNITTPIPFLIPHFNEMRSSWLIKLGLLLYDLLAGRSSIPKSSSVDISIEYPNILKSKFNKGFKYYDIQVDDLKLVKLNINDAKKRGAKIFENKKVIKVTRNRNFWTIVLSNNIKIEAKILINASGPWIDEIVKNIIKIKSNISTRLVKGSHIIVKKIYDHNIALTLQNIDRRIIFIIPYKKKFSLIGTTEVKVSSPKNPKINKKEIEYLIKGVNKFLKKQINRKDIVETYSGIRPLIEDHKNNLRKVTRDYVLDLNLENKSAPLLNIYGGKLTTYRKLSEKAVEKLKPFFPETKTHWTHKKKL